MLAKIVNLKNVLKIFLAAFAIGDTNQTTIENAVLDQETGQMMECRHLIKHENPKIRTTWKTSVANEMGSLFLGVGKGDEEGQRIK